MEICTSNLARRGYSGPCLPKLPSTVCVLVVGRLHHRCIGCLDLRLIRQLPCLRPVDEFVAFQIKIIMQGTNCAEPPRIKDFRTIALVT